MGKVVSSIFGSGSSGSSSSQSSGDPIKQQAFAIGSPLFQSTVTSGMNLLNRINANPAYTGQRVAGLNPFQVSSANNLGALSQDAANVPYATLNTGLNNLTAGGNFGANAQNIFDQYNGIDPTQSILDNANLYAANPYVDGLIDASSRDVVRNLTESTLPTLNRQFAGTGNTNSTRAGVESAIAQRGAADRLADLSSQIRSQFFGKGLDMAQNQFNQNLRNSLDANNQLFNAGSLGNNTINSGLNQGRSVFDFGQLAGNMFQTQNQNELNANKAQFDEERNNVLNALQILSGVSSAGQGWSGGPTSTSGTEQKTSTPSIASIAGSIIGAFSDIRMKENIELVGKTAGGVNVYDFDYKPEFKELAGHGRFRGVMADELEKVIPEAVIVASNGYKMVDYSKVK